MSVTDSIRERDTVEEFWDADVVALYGTSATSTTIDDFTERLKLFLGSSGRMWPAVSGRAALLHALVQTGHHGGSAPRNSVLVCSFNCMAVAESVMQAGLVPETYDLSTTAGSINWAQVAELLKPYHHSIIIPHLFGVPCNFLPVLKIANDLGVLVIEDCAHTLGGKIENVSAGTVGDLAIFSFSYDKPISLGGGGALLINNPDLVSRLRLPSCTVSLDVERLEMADFIAFLRDRRKQIRPPSVTTRIRHRLTSARSHPFRTPTGIGALRSGLGIWQLDRYNSILERRYLNAKQFYSIPGWRAWHVDENVRPSWLRQKLIPEREVDVEKPAERLRRQGLRVGRFNWPATVDRLLSQSIRPVADYVATYGLDIPVHQSMRPNELALIQETLGSVNWGCRVQ